MPSPNVNLKHLLRSVHTWLGLIAGLFIVAMGLSGAIIIFRDYFEGSSSPKVAAVTQVALKMIEPAMKRSIEAIQPAAHINRIIFPGSPTEPLLVHAETGDKKRLQVFVDPTTGSALGIKQKLGWLDWIVDLHQNLLLGKTGRALTGVIGVALLLLSVSGMLSWLNGPRDWKRSLALPKPGPWSRINYHAHRCAGLWTNLLMIVVSLTGIILAYPETVQQAISAVTRESRSLQER